MEFPAEQIEELVALYPGTKVAAEAGCRYFLIPDLPLPKGRSPTRMDALLCPTDRDGYPSRLFFAQQVVGGRGTNWNANHVRILEQNWFALSWRIRTGLRLAQMVSAHLDALR